MSDTNMNSEVMSTLIFNRSFPALLLNLMVCKHFQLVHAHNFSSSLSLIVSAYAQHVGLKANIPSKIFSLFYYVALILLKFYKVFLTLHYRQQEHPENIDWKHHDYYVVSTHVYILAAP